MPAPRGHLGDAVQHGIGRIVVGNPRRELGEIGVGLDGQVIDREVRRRHGQRLRQVLLQLVHGLARQRVHQVEIEGLEGGGRLFQRGDGLGAVVHAAQRLEVRVVEALHTDRQPRHAGRSGRP